MNIISSVKCECGNNLNADYSNPYSGNHLPIYCDDCEIYRMKVARERLRATEKTEEEKLAFRKKEFGEIL